jgi:hypothetical protein
VYILNDISVTLLTSHAEISPLKSLAASNTTREGATKRKERPTHHKQQHARSITTQKNRTCENCDPMKLELSYSKDTTAEGVAKGREIALTASHMVHRTSIPFGYVLIELRCCIKHCTRGCNTERKREREKERKREREKEVKRTGNNGTKKRKTNPQPTTKNKTDRFKTQNQNINTCENCVIR